VFLHLAAAVIDPAGAAGRRDRARLHESIAFVKLEQTIFAAASAVTIIPSISDTAASSFCPN
jgi:hypothetical protein